MKRLVVALFAFSVTIANATPYTDAKAIWVKSADSAAYQNYAAEFSQFNNHFQLDLKNGCYAKGSGSVNLMLLITHHDKSSEFAVIEDVVSDVNNEKAECFIQTYKGVPTKAPPFLPFVLQMTMK